MREELLKVAKEFPFLERANFDVSDAAYRIVVDTVQEDKGTETQAFLTGFTLFLLPMKSGATYELTGTVSRGSQKLKTYQATGDFNMIFHLLFILPVTWRPGVIAATLDDTYRDLFLQIQRDLPQLFGTGG